MDTKHRRRECVCLCVYACSSAADSASFLQQCKKTATIVALAHAGKCIGLYLSCSSFFRSISLPLSLPRALSRILEHHLVGLKKCSDLSLPYFLPEYKSRPLFSSHSLSLEASVSLLIAWRKNTPALGASPTLSAYPRDKPELVGKKAAAT